MPLVRIEIIAGKTEKYKAQLLNGVHRALVEALGIEEDDRFQRLYELPPEHFEKSAEKTEDFTLIEITMFCGRTREQKARLYKAIASELQTRLNIRPEDIFIVLHEPPDENFGFAGKMRGEG